MKASYVWGWQLPEGTQALTWDKLNYEEVDKRSYVIDFLDPCVREARCGWYGVVYAVTEDAYGDRKEWVLMFADQNDTPNEARWINVSGNSRGAIAEAVWSLVFS